MLAPSSRSAPALSTAVFSGEASPPTIGLSGRDEAEVVRITWPNGVVQSLVNSKAGVPLVVIQKDGLIGSCPFLYAWNGETYTFISDVLGITPLGLPMAPGMLVPPDHDEFVLVTGEQLVAREVDGGSYYDFQFTEELREVTYLDKVRLDIVDHPVGSEIFPDERFTFPPFPAEHTHMTIAPKGPLRAMQVTYTKDAPAGTLDVGEHKSERDWATELAAIDGDYAAPFTHYQGRFQGLTPLHALELTFDKEQVCRRRRAAPIHDGLVLLDQRQCEHGDRAHAGNRVHAAGVASPGWLRRLARLGPASWIPRR